VALHLHLIRLPLNGRQRAGNGAAAGCWVTTNTELNAIAAAAISGLR